MFENVLTFTLSYESFVSSEMINSTSYFSIKGLVGAGKSSLIKCLPALLEPEGCKIVSEPVHLYTSFMEGLYNPLEELQMDPIQSVVAGQSHIIQLSRCYYNDQVFEALLAHQCCRAIKTKGMVFRYTWVYSKEDTMAHTRRLVVTS